MLNDLKNLAAQSLREHGLRALLALLCFAGVVAACYALCIDDATSRTAVGAVAWSRFYAARLWVAATAVYTLLTLFKGYGEARRCYATLLLPASSEAKFAWEIGRTLVLFPAATLALWWLADTLALRYMTGTYPALAAQLDAADSLFVRITEAEGPLRHAPAVLYALVWFHAVATVARVGLPRPAAVGIALTLFVLSLIWGTQHWPFVSSRFVFPLPGGYWISRVGWCSRTAETLLVHAWYLLLPATIYLWSYYRFKERTLS